MSPFASKTAPLAKFPWASFAEGGAFPPMCHVRNTKRSLLWGWVLLCVLSGSAAAETLTGVSAHTGAVWNGGSAAGFSNAAGTAGTASDAQREFSGISITHNFHNSDSSAHTFQVTAVLSGGSDDHWRYDDGLGISPTLLNPSITWSPNANFTPYLCWQKTASGAFPAFRSDFSDSFTIDYTLLVDGAPADSVTVNFDITGTGLTETSTFTAQSAPLALSIDWEYGQVHQSGALVTLDLTLQNETGSNQSASIGYYDPEIASAVQVWSGTLPAGETTILENVTVPEGATLQAEAGGAAPVAVQGDHEFFVNAADTAWHAWLLWGEYNQVSVSGIYRVLHPVSGTFSLMAGTRVLATYDLEVSPLVHIDPQSYNLPALTPLSLDTKNLQVEDLKWYGVDSGNKVQTNFPGIELAEGGAFQFDITIVGVDPDGENQSVGTSTITETERVNYVDGEARTERVRSSEFTVTSGPSSGQSFRTVVDTGTGTQVSDVNGAPPITEDQRDMLREAQLAGIREEIARIREHSQRIQTDGETHEEGNNNYLNAMSEGAMVAIAGPMQDALNPAGTGIIDLGGPAAMPAVASLDWEIPVPIVGSVNVDPGAIPQAQTIFGILRGIITVGTSMVFLWFVVTKLHESVQDFSRAQQGRIFNVNIFGNSFSWAAIPLWIAVMAGVVVTGFTLVSAATGLTGSDYFHLTVSLANLFSGSGEVVQRIWYLLNLVLPIPHLLSTGASLFGFVVIRTGVTALYTGALRAMMS